MKVLLDIPDKKADSLMDVFERGDSDARRGVGKESDLWSSNRSSVLQDSVSDCIQREREGWFKRGCFDEKIEYNGWELHFLQPNTRKGGIMTLTFATTFAIFFCLSFVLFFWGVSVYNGLVTHRNRYKNAFAQIDVQLKRRYDLIPNLVETAKGYMAHEKNTLEAVINARNAAFGASNSAAKDPTDGKCIKDLNRAEGELAGALSKLMVVVEQYPDLKANQNMLALQEELTSTENKVAFSRQAFNDAVMTYNTAREVFPSNLIAGMLNFSEASPFEIENPGERTAPKVAFG